MNIQTVDYCAPDAPQRFVASLRESGFAVLTRHPLPWALIEKIYADWALFFASADKQAFRFDPERQDGWFPSEISELAKGASERDLKEYYHIYPWGRVPAHLRRDALAYYASAQALAEQLLSWVEAGLPKEVASQLREPLCQMILRSRNTLLRVLHYPAFMGSTAPNALRAAAHEDINLLTLLPAASMPGLQVLTRDGQWLSVPCVPGAVVINVGDMLQEACSGWLPSTTHRVANPQGEAAKVARLSLPLFLHPRDEVVLSHRYTARSYLNERLQELGVRTM